ncbi:MAG TPA: glutamate racemase [Longimicrobium sp.]|nr:glutamate racemase [Longimicrobium sp.]
MTAPVGVFDSGVGGLSVAREIRRALPAEHLLYVSDTAYLPYGDRTDEEVRARTVAIGEWVQAQGAKVLVVACNTASGAALEALRERLTIPVIGLEPALKPAVRETRNGRVGVMATRGTLRSARFQRLVDAYADGVQVVRDPCPGLADLVEDGLLAGPELAARMEGYVAPLREAGVDTVVLGCTHYVFVRDAVQAALGPEVRLLDSGPAIARRTRQILQEAGALQEGGSGGLRLLTTGDPEEVAAIVQRLWGEPVQVESLEV